MKKRFFIFFIVICLLPCVSAFGECSCSALKKWKHTDGNIDDFLKCGSIECSRGSFSPIRVALAAAEAADVNYNGNWEAVDAILQKDADAAKGLESEYPRRPAIQMVIDNCCNKGNNETSEIVGLLIQNDPDTKNLVVRASMGNMETHNNIYDKESTMLDYVRYKMQYVDNCKNAEQCKKIEQVLVNAGAKTYEELRSESPDSATVTETPVVTETLKTDVEQKEEEVPFEEVKEDEEVETLIQNNVAEFNKPVSVSESAINDVDKAQQDLQNKKLDFSKINVDSFSDTAQQNNIDEEKQNALEEKQNAYDKAHETEQSTANKLLTGLSTAATGIGGMQLMQGLAEQSSDDDAMADMAAYIAVNARFGRTIF